MLWKPLGMALYCFSTSCYCLLNETMGKLKQFELWAKESYPPQFRQNQKEILDRINNKITSTSNFNQWKNTTSVIDSAYDNITSEERNIIIHAKNSILVHKQQSWQKKGDTTFDVTMGSYDGAETCELVGSFLLSQLQNLPRRRTSRF